MAFIFSDVKVQVHVKKYRFLCFSHYFAQCADCWMMDCWFMRSIDWLIVRMSFLKTFNDIYFSEQKWTWILFISSTGFVCVAPIQSNFWILCVILFLVGTRRSVTLTRGHTHQSEHSPVFPGRHWRPWIQGQTTANEISAKRRHRIQWTGVTCAGRHHLGRSQQHAGTNHSIFPAFWRLIAWFVIVVELHQPN